MTEQQRAKRNLNPHKAARLAMYMWGARYAAQRGGSMDFWDSLSDSERHLCRGAVKAILESRDETDKELAGRLLSLSIAVDPLDFICQVRGCRALPGEPCKDEFGRQLSRAGRFGEFHPSRVSRAKGTNLGRRHKGAL